MPKEDSVAKENLNPKSDDDDEEPIAPSEKLSVSEVHRTEKKASIEGEMEPGLEPVSVLISPAEGSVDKVSPASSSLGRASAVIEPTTTEDDADSARPNKASLKISMKPGTAPSVPTEAPVEEEEKVLKLLLLACRVPSLCNNVWWRSCLFYLL